MNGYLRLASLAAALLWAAPATAATYTYTYNYVGAPFTWRTGCVGGAYVLGFPDVGPNVVATVVTVWDTQIPTGTWSGLPVMLGSGGQTSGVFGDSPPFLKNAFITVENGVVVDWFLSGDHSFGGFSSSIFSSPAGDSASRAFFGVPGGSAMASAGGHMVRWSGSGDAAAPCAAVVRQRARAWQLAGLAHTRRKRRCEVKPAGSSLVLISTPGVSQPIMAVSIADKVQRALAAFG